ncbi:MAG: tetratricopeptide repeat protein [Deltaproteobacteria bacterium]|nr:tetratricopeptide repeat protein [Deltaproteobacteria bacterium]
MKNIKNVYYIITLIVIPQCLACVPHKSIKDRIDAASAYLEAGDAAMAEKEYLTIIEQAPKQLRAYRGLIKASLKTGHIKVLQKHYESTLKMSPDSPIALYCLGLIALAQGKKDQIAKAITLFDHASRLAPKVGEYKYRAGLACLLTGNAEDAIERIDKALEISPGQARYYPAAADAYLRIGKARKTLELLSRMLNYRPRIEDIKLGRAIIVKASNPFTGVPSAGQGKLDALLKQAESGILGEELSDQVQALLVKYEKCPLLHYLAGLAKLESENRAQGIAELKKAIHLAPMWADPVLALATVFESLGRQPEAEKLYYKASRLNPLSVEIRYKRARLLMADDKPDEAAKELIKVVALTNGSVASRLACADALTAAEKPAEARKQLETILKSHPDQVEAIFRLAQLELKLAAELPKGMLKNKALEKAKMMIDKLRKLTPKNKKRINYLNRQLEQI